MPRKPADLTIHKHSRDTDGPWIHLSVDPVESVTIGDADAFHDLLEEQELKPREARRIANWFNRFADWKESNG